MDFNDLYHDTNDRVKNLLHDKYDLCANLERIGLDPRSASKLYICDEGIIVYLDNDRTLQYYGGFEYVDSIGCRYQLGDWVFYSAEDDRVRDHIDRFYNRKDINADPNVLAFLVDREFSFFNFEDIVEAYTIRKDGVTETHVKTANGWSVKHLAEEARTFCYDPTGRITCIVEH